ncbi:hypothetical protein [Marinoscillum luteum]|uniref:Uncharacterized protein n=1 Tax=Marinoscillum luteum TaxID=861051 RepID=A0ABW7N6Y2_9BACT
MKKLKQIVCLTLAMVIVAVSSGFSFHSIECQMTGEEFHSVITKSCCCGSPMQKESKKCCDEESVVLELDEDYTLEHVTTQISPVFLAAFISSFVFDGIPSVSQKFDSVNLKSPPLPKREIIILVQSFLL